MATLPSLPTAVPHLAAYQTRWIQDLLHHHLYLDAVFLAERLPGFPDVEDGTVLEVWTEALLSAGEYSRIRWQLQGLKDRSLSPRVHYLLALACIRLERYGEAEVALLSGNLDLVESWRNGHVQPLEHVVEGAAGTYQLGRVAEEMGRKKQALECYASCLKKCPYMWCAFERFSWLSLCQRDNHRGHSKNFEDPSHPSRPSLPTTARITLSRDPRSVGDPSTDVVIQGWIPHTPRKRRRSRSSKKRQQQSKAPASAASPSVCSVLSPRKSGEQSSAEQSSARVELSPAATHPEAPAPAKLVLPIVFEESLSTINGEQAEVRTPEKETAQSEEMVTVLQGVAEALHAMQGFHCQDALDILSKLPMQEQESAVCQDLAARCNFELQNYKDAARIYKQCFARHKFHSALGVEYYSTALWHLGDRLELGLLARQVLESSRLQPQAWCVVGNSLSLEKEHEKAIRCFQRAIQLNPKQAYARTLLGHELLALEKHDKAVQQYRSALNVDVRQYGAWWGLGKVCQFQEDLVQAKYNFLRAVEINGSNQVLRTSLGMVLQALGEPLQALQLFNRAAESSHCRALAFFQKACVLSSQEEHGKAACELAKARCLAPREPCIHVQLGRAHVGLGNTQEALQHFTNAMDFCATSGDHQLSAAAEEELRKAMPSEARSGSSSAALIAGTLFPHEALGNDWLLQ